MSRKQFFYRVWNYNKHYIVNYTSKFLLQQAFFKGQVLQIDVFKVVKVQKPSTTNIKIYFLIWVNTYPV